METPPERDRSRRVPIEMPDPVAPSDIVENCVVGMALASHPDMGEMQIRTNTTKEGWSDSPIGWPGVERRHHWMFVTLNTEYHLRDRVCVGVRDRSTGRWLDRHPVLGQRLSMSFRNLPSHGLIPNMGVPHLGECLYFENGRDRQVVTSPVADVRRPPREALRNYAALVE